MPKHGKIRIGDIDTLIQADTTSLDVLGSTFELSLPVYTDASFGYCRVYNNPKLFDHRVYVFCSTVFDKKNLHVFLHAEPTCVFYHQKYVFVGFKNGTIGFLSIEHSMDEASSASPVFEYINRVFADKGRPTRLKNLFSIFSQDDSSKHEISSLIYHNNFLYSIDEKLKIVCWRISSKNNVKSELVKVAEFCLPSQESQGNKFLKFFTSHQQSDTLLVSCDDKFFEVSDLTKNVGVVCYGRNDIFLANISTIMVSDIGVFIVGYENGAIRLYLRGNACYVKEFAFQGKSKIQAIIPAFYATPSKTQKSLSISEGLNLVSVLADDLQIYVFELDDQSSYQLKTKINIVDELEKSISNLDSSKIQASFFIWAFRWIQ